MALTLKRYQREALAALARFFALARGARDEAALDAAFRQTLLEQEHAAETIPPYLAQGFVSDEGATPYVCVRIPTGGGKTLLGAHALAAAARHYTGQDRPLALWLVPTNVIRQQTLAALKTPGHPYREALEAHFGVDGVRVLDIADSDQIRPQDIGARALVIVGTLQTLRVDDTSGRDVYAYKEAFEPHFERAPELPGFERVSERDLEVQPYLGRTDLGKVKRSFANLMYWHRPVVIIDEAHNARTPLSYDSFARLRPAALIEMTATPVRQGRHRSNVLYHVSAEELKAEEMIKLPIVLSAHPNWEEAVRDALLTRTRLAEEAARELAAGGDYLRPILLLQAEDKRGEITVERLREHLITQEHVAPERIAVATGTQRELDGVNLFDPACPVEVVITVEALKEGWDCSFAYVFCSLQNVGSSRDMEQLLGRVLRMPYAKRRRSELLNRAYAHLASTQSARVAGELADRLVAMGFEELEAVQAVFPTSLPLFGDAGAEGEPSAPALPALELMLPAAAATDLFALDAAAATPALRIEMRPDGDLRVCLDAPPPPELRAALVGALPERKAREALMHELDRFELRHRAFTSPSQRGVVFRPLPLLCVRDAQGELELAERETLLDLAGFALAEQPPELPGFRPDESASAYLVDLDHGRLRIEQERAGYAVNLDLVPTTVSETDLLHWLDARLREPGTPQPQMLAWLVRVLRWLERHEGHTLTALVRHRNRLADALAERLRVLREHAQRQGLQRVLTSFETPACISAEYVFVFGRGLYPARPPYYIGRHRFAKHYYGVVGDLQEAAARQSDHEYHCAVALDGLPEVRHWVRNLPRFPEFSFWLPTASDRFYPDFVAELEDGRLLVVEYKGEGYKSSDDAVEKQRVGELWAGLSGNLFLLAVERDAQGRGVAEQLRTCIGAGECAIPEHARVVARVDIGFDGGVVPEGSEGTVVSVYDGGAAYAVEFGAMAGPMGVVFAAAATLRRVS